MILDRTWEMLRQDGRKEVESTVLWGGRRFGEEAVVMSVLYPCGADVAFARRLLRVGADTAAEMGRWLRAEEQRALIQVHTHPSGWVDHSPTDDRYPISSADGFVSVVWPHFARMPLPDFSTAGVHQLRAGQFHRLSPGDAADLLRVVESEVMIWSRDPRLDEIEEDAE